MNIDTKHHLERNIEKLDKMIKALDTEIRFNKEVGSEVCRAYNHLRIARDNMKEAIK